MKTRLDKDTAESKECQTENITWLYVRLFYMITREKDTRNLDKKVYNLAIEVARLFILLTSYTHFGIRGMVIQ